MPEGRQRRRTPAPNFRRTRPPQPSPSPHRRNRPSSRRSRNPPRQADQVLRRCNSEPNLRLAGLAAGADEEHRNLVPPGAVLYRPHTCVDIFSPPELGPSQSPSKIEGQQGYIKDAKVVVNVTVEGSPGPIRTMVKLGSSVEETVKLVVNKYSEEGRRPQLEKDAASTFELHQSHFTLEIAQVWTKQS